MAIAVRPRWHQLVRENFVRIWLRVEIEPPAVALCDVLSASTIRGEPRMIASCDWAVEDVAVRVSL